MYQCHFYSIVINNSISILLMVYYAIQINIYDYIATSYDNIETNGYLERNGGGF